MRKRGLLALAASLILTSCTTASPHTITVFAAASLQRAFTAEAKAFEAAHPGVHVQFSFAGSQVLVAQIREGAPADVLATASLSAITSVRSHLVGGPSVLAHNRLAIVTSGRSDVRTLADLQKLKVVVAGPTVPLGIATTAALARARIVLHPVSQEDSDTGVITKVRLGEVDAGIAYASDLVGTGLSGVALAGTETSLEIGAIDHNGDAFLAFVLSPAGQQILVAAGFS